MQEEKNILSVPIAIVVAGIIIAGAIFVSNGNKSGSDKAVAAVNAGNQAAAAPKVSGEMRAVDPNEHILGNPNADIMLVEYSDMECPFCKMFHETTKKIMAEYGQSGKVALVYRHFPLDQLHSKARNEAEATECAWSLGGANGNDKFWAFYNGIMDITPSNNGLDPAELPKMAVKIGLDETAFNTCLSSGKFKDKVQADETDGLKLGVQGTPYSVLVSKSTGEKVPINGAQPYETVKQMIETLLVAKK
ncbi:MAG: thioredoxin domain-containing protein [Candidatus Paceibacterota bacterium]